MDIWVEEIEGWESHPFSGGYAGLHELADSDFSGAVSAGSTWALFVNGRVVAVRLYKQTAAGPEFEEGDIERFADAEGTIYEAPHPSVPLLVAMTLADGETRGRYYTQQTPIEEVDQTLTEGGFTGYLELSENVLSGDYYTVYQAGRSMDLAFVGNSRRLKTETDARDDARGEVGIYEVVAADIDVTEIPDTGDASPGVGTDGAAATDDEETDEDRDTEAADGDDRLGAVAGGTSVAATAAKEAVDDEQPTADDDGVADVDDDGVGTTRDDSPVEAEAVSEGEPTAGHEQTDDLTETDDSTETTSEPSADPHSVEAEAVETERPSEDERGHEDPAAAVARVSTEEETAAADDPASDVPDERPAESAPSNTPAAPTADDPPTPTGAAASPTEQLASRSIPSLDPERTEEGDGSASASGGRRDRPNARRDPDPTPSREPEPRQATTADDDEIADLREELEGVRESLTVAEGERETAREELARVEAELDRVRAERNEVETERDELRAEAERLRGRVSDLEAELGASGDGPSLTEAEALAGTNLFVRYQSKGKTTVEDAHDGNGDPDDLRANLRITSHTRFEAEEASVDGRPFEEWLHASQRYRFAEWLVAQLVFEVRDTGAAERLRDLYDALPAIDRIELDGSIAVADGEEEVDIGFDIVCRDRMGEPLFAANLDASREPVGEAEMAELVTDAVAVCRDEKTFAGAFYVTAAFYESPALETARDATSGSLLSRDSRLSYLKESRNRGFHLALVESRDDAFHLSVPDL